MSKKIQFELKIGINDEEFIGMVEDEFNNPNLIEYLDNFTTDFASIICNEISYEIKNNPIKSKFNSNISQYTFTFDIMFDNDGINLMNYVNKLMKKPAFVYEDYGDNEELIEFFDGDFFLKNKEFKELYKKYALIDNIKDLLNETKLLTVVEFVIPTDIWWNFN